MYLTKKKITLPMDAGNWFMPVLEFHGIREIPVTSEIALLSAALPKIHRDPMDRRRYPQIKTIW